MAMWVWPDEEEVAMWVWPNEEEVAMWVWPDEGEVAMREVKMTSRGLMCHHDHHHRLTTGDPHWLTGDPSLIDYR